MRRYIVLSIFQCLAGLIVDWAESEEWIESQKHFVLSMKPW